MKILIVNHYAGSPYHGMVFRHYYLAKEWVKMGHDVTIVAASFTHIRIKNPDMDGDKIKIEMIDGIRYIWLKTPEYKGNGMGRILNMLSFIISLKCRQRKIGDLIKPDIVISSSTYNLDIYTCKKIADRHKARLIYEVRDLWPLSPQVLKNLPSWHPYIWTLQKAEDYACRHTDLIISVISKADKHLLERGMPSERYAVIANGISLDENTTDNSVPDLHTKILKNYKNKFLVGYLGGMKISYGLDLLIDVANIVKNDLDIQFVLVGEGPEKVNLERKANELGLINVRFLPAIPKTTVRNFLGLMDVLVATLPKTPLLKYGYGMSQNKVFDYMLAGKPILRANIVDDDVVLKSSCGYVCDPSNPQDMAKKLLEIKAMSDKQRQEMGARGRECVIKNFTYPILAKKYLQVVHKTA